MEVTQSPLSILSQSLNNFPNNFALEVNGQNFSFFEFDTIVNTVADYLVDQEIKAGDITPLCIEDSSIFYTAMFACWKIGAVPVPINMTLPADVRHSILDKTQAHRIIDQNGTGPLALGITNYENGTQTNAFDASLILFTSGSTGVPKGVICTGKMLATNAVLMRSKLELTSNDRIFINTPPYYTSAICHLLTAFSAGAGLISKSGFFFGADLIAEMASTKCTGFGGAPAHILRLIDAYENSNIDYTPRFIMSSGDHLPEQTIRRIQSSLPSSKLYVVYGLSEVGGRLCVLNPNEISTKIGSVGKPLPDMRIEILTDKGLENSSGTLGEVIVNGNLLTPRYFNAPEETAKAIDEVGFHTKDLGYIDEDGFLFIEGRMDDIFKSGEKVSSRLIELTLKDLDEITDAAVIAADDCLLGLVPVAFICMKDGKSFQRKKVIKHLKEKLPHTHLPKKILELNNIPRTGSGKVIRNKLKSLATKQ